MNNNKFIIFSFIMLSFLLSGCADLLIGFSNAMIQEGTKNQRSQRQNSYLEDDYFIKRSLKEAAENGDVNAQYEIAEIYEDHSMMNFGYKWEDLEDRYRSYHKEAIKWYTKAAEQGHSGAMVSLAWIYKRGKGVPQDYKKAFELYSKASELGNLTAMQEMAELYSKGEGVEVNGEKAVELYKKCIEYYKKHTENGEKLSDQTKAENTLGRMYFNGDGVKKDYKEAFKWFKEAGENTGMLYASYDLGYMYENGYGTEKDYKKAFQCYRTANTYYKADYRRAYLYEHGLGIEKDVHKALELYERNMNYCKQAEFDDYYKLSKEGYERVKAEIEKNKH